MDKIRVDLSKVYKDNSYDILIGNNIVNTAKIGHVFDSLNVKGRVCVITCETVNELYGDLLKKFLTDISVESIFLILPDGEETKSLRFLSKIYDELVENRFERSDFIIAFGGGVIGDIAGFAASTYLRGINLIQLPTTLLSDVDSSVGGKTAIDHPGGKNLIGAFYQPSCVIVDSAFLSTLPPREIKNGLAEVIKYGAILDEELFKYLEKNKADILSLNSQYISYIIQRSCSLKAFVVGKDEREGGLRSVLNFGHSLGHAIELLYDFKNYKHGEAIAIGMIFAATLSKELGICSNKTVERIKSLMKNYELSTEIPNFSPDEYINAMKSDKKVNYSLIKFVLIKDIGEFVFKELDFNYLHDFLSKIMQRND